MNIPGYTFDGKRYYKILPGHPNRPPLAAPAPKPSAASEEPSRKKAKRRKEKGKERAVERVVRTWPNAGILWDMREGPIGRGKTMAIQHELESVGMSSMRSAKIIYPDCLPLDDDIVRISFDALHPNTIRVGGSSGVIATGSLNRPPSDLSSYYPNSNGDNEWRSGWCFPSAITSLNTCGERILATCLGAPAQAIVGTTTDTMSLASVTLSPRKTSLWTSALTKDCIALGCDTKVLTTRDPTSSSHSMDGYVTGSRHGGGAVFALDIHGNSIFAGVRSGQVKMFDMRSSSTQGAGGDEEPRRSEIDIKINSSVTHVKYISSTNSVLVSGLNGTLALYDPRHHQRPVLSMKGHQNQYTRDVGFDVWRNEFVAAAGQDNRVRIWSLRTGLPIPPPPPPTHLKPPQSGFVLETEPDPSLLHRQFASPVKALKFREGGRGDVELWVGDGGALECFGIKRT